MWVWLLDLASHAIIKTCFGKLSTYNNLPCQEGSRSGLIPFPMKKKIKMILEWGSGSKKCPHLVSYYLLIEFYEKGVAQECQELIKTWTKAKLASHQGWDPIINRI